MEIVTVGFYIGFACILAGLWIYVIVLNERIAAANDDDDKIEKNVERLANHLGLDYPPKEHITPAKTIPEKRVIKWEKLKK